ncbi:hypothetical protein O9992_07230 [Vibrio lentus]|nr:hypothetical protein [Vibrio lentus]
MNCMWLLLLFIAVLSFAVIYFVNMERGQHRIVVNYAKRVNKVVKCLQHKVLTCHLRLI